MVFLFDFCYTLDFAVNRSISLRFIFSREIAVNFVYVSNGMRTFDCDKIFRISFYEHTAAAAAANGICRLPMKFHVCASMSAYSVVLGYYIFFFGQLIPFRWHMM